MINTFSIVSDFKRVYIYDCEELISAEYQVHLPATSTAFIFSEIKIA